MTKLVNEFYKMNSFATKKIPNKIDKYILLNRLTTIAGFLESFKYSDVVKSNKSNLVLGK